MKNASVEPLPRADLMEGCVTKDDTVFSGSIPSLYDRYLGPLIFEPYAEDLAHRLSALDAARVLETATGTGIVTAPSIGWQITRSASSSSGTKRFVRVAGGGHNDLGAFAVARAKQFIAEQFPSRIMHRQGRSR
jgi:hypothetical protein